MLPTHLPCSFLPILPTFHVFPSIFSRIKCNKISVEVNASPMKRDHANPILQTCNDIRYQLHVQYGHVLFSVSHYLYSISVSNGEVGPSDS